MEPVYNFISRRPGAPRRDRRHAHLCVSWAPAQVASPFAAPQRLMLLLLPPPLPIAPAIPCSRFASLCRFSLLRRSVCSGQVARRRMVFRSRTHVFPYNFQLRATNMPRAERERKEEEEDKRDVQQPSLSNSFLQKCKTVFLINVFREIERNFYFFFS